MRDHAARTTFPGSLTVIGLPGCRTDLIYSGNGVLVAVLEGQCHPGLPGTTRLHVNSAPAVNLPGELVLCFPNPPRGPRFLSAYLSEPRFARVPGQLTGFPLEACRHLARIRPYPPPHLPASAALLARLADDWGDTGEFDARL